MKPGYLVYKPMLHCSFQSLIHQMPFQLRKDVAGELMKSPTVEQYLSCSFHFCTLQQASGDVGPEVLLSKPDYLAKSWLSYLAQ